jgi:hypothetical protein
MPGAIECLSIVQRTRSAPPTSSTDVGDVGIVSLPAELPALTVLVEEARAPGAARAEVDALIAGLSQPLPPEASPRERADLLLSLMEDAQIADYTGSDGRTVRVAAVQALLSLGYPYALEVPPEALEAKVREEGGFPGLLSTRKGQVGFGLVTLAGIAQLIPLFFLVHESLLSWSDSFAWLVLAAIVGTTLLPALLTVLGHNLGSRGLKKTGIGWLAASSFLWLVPGLLGFGAFPFNLIALAMGGVILTAPILMSSQD